MIKQLALGLLLVICLNSSAQNTVGTTFINQNVFEAYTLISADTKAYLINNCGEVINDWSSTYPPRKRRIPITQW